MKQIAGLTVGSEDTPRQKEKEARKEKDKKDGKAGTLEERRKQSCELDPMRFAPEDAKDDKRRERLREKNVATLIAYCDMIFDAITSSIAKFPINLRCL